MNVYVTAHKYTNNIGICPQLPHQGISAGMLKAQFLTMDYEWILNLNTVNCANLFKDFIHEISSKVDV